MPAPSTPRRLRWSGDQAVAQRNAALVAQSRYLARQAADDVLKNGAARGAIALLRVALPGPTAPTRPLVQDAVKASYQALYANRERRQMAMPPGATAVAADPHGDRIVIATRSRFSSATDLAPTANV